MSIFAVAPCLGVWIEIHDFYPFIPGIESHPVWVCGFKSTGTVFKVRKVIVTPRLGVWI